MTKALYLAFYSASFYRDVAHKWKGTGFGYFFLLVSIFALPVTLRVQADLRSLFEENAPQYISQLPVMTITGGVLSAEGPQPLMIIEKKTGQPVLLIDTSEKPADIESTKAHAVITKTTMTIRTGPGTGQTRTYRLSDLGPEKIVIDRGTAYDFIDSLIAAVPVIVYPVSLVFFSAVWGLSVITLSIAGRLFARKVGVQLDMKSLLRLSVAAITPSLLAGTLLMTAGISVSGWWIVSIAAALGYMFFAIHSNRADVVEEMDEKDPRS